MSAGLKRLPVLTDQTDQSILIIIIKPVPLQQRLAKKPFLLRQHAVKAQVIGRYPAIKLTTCDMPLFDAKRTKRFGAIGLNSKISTMR